MYNTLTACIRYGYPYRLKNQYEHSIVNHVLKQRDFLPSNKREEFSLQAIINQKLKFELPIWFNGTNYENCYYNRALEIEQTQSEIQGLPVFMNPYGTVTGRYVCFGGFNFHGINETIKKWVVPLNNKHSILKIDVKSAEVFHALKTYCPPAYQWILAGNDIYEWYANKYNLSRSDAKRMFIMGMYGANVQGLERFNLPKDGKAFAIKNQSSCQVWLDDVFLNAPFMPSLMIHDCAYYVGDIDELSMTENYFNSLEIALDKSIGKTL